LTSITPGFFHELSGTSRDGTGLASFQPLYENPHLPAETARAELDRSRDAAAAIQPSKVRKRQVQEESRFGGTQDPLAIEFRWQVVKRFGHRLTALGLSRAPLRGFLCEPWED
jgi:hypothetical protein